MPRIKNTNAVVTLPESTAEFISKLQSKLTFKHPSGTSYVMFDYVADLFDLEMKFTASISGIIAEYDRNMIKNSIKTTWDLTVQQTSIASAWASGKYQLVFMDTKNQLIDQQAAYYTNIIYFVQKDGKQLADDDFELTPKYEWFGIQAKANNLPYTFVDSNGLISYDSLYYIDFIGPIDESQYTVIKSTLKTTFKNFYNGNFSDYLYFVINIDWN